jgi:hypothetical protein
MLRKVIVIFLLWYSGSCLGLTTQTNSTSPISITKVSSSTRCLNRSVVYGNNTRCLDKFTKCRSNIQIYEIVGYDYRNPIRLAQNQWASSRINVNIARILLTEVVGIQTTIVEVITNDMWEPLANGSIHASLEFW